MATSNRLTESRRRDSLFVEWWEKHVTPNKGTRTDLSAERSFSLTDAEEATGLSHQQVSRVQLIEQQQAQADTRKRALLDEANGRPAKTSRLSALQRRILAIAWKYRGMCYCYSDIYNCDVKAEVFGWPVGRAWSRYEYGRGWYREWEPDRSVHPGTARRQTDSMPQHGQIFNRAAIGEAQYNRVSATVNRSLRRLVEKNLLVKTGAGYSLTKHAELVTKVSL